MEKIWIILHFVGVVLGAGSVTTAYARELYFRWHPEHHPRRGILPVITPLVTAGFILVILSGFGLYGLDAQNLSASPLFLLKIGLVVGLLLNHIILNAYIRPRYAQMQAVGRVSDYVSLVGWYVIVIISVFL